MSCRVIKPVDMFISKTSNTDCASRGWCMLDVLEFKTETEMVWTCPEEGPYIYQWKDAGVGTGRQGGGGGRAEERFMDEVKEIMKLLVVREEDAEERVGWRQMIGRGLPAEKDEAFIGRGSVRVIQRAPVAAS